MISLQLALPGSAIFFAVIAFVLFLFARTFKGPGAGVAGLCVFGTGLTSAVVATALTLLHIGTLLR